MKKVSPADLQLLHQRLIAANWLLVDLVGERDPDHSDHNEAERALVARVLDCIFPGDRVLTLGAASDALGSRLRDAQLDLDLAAAELDEVTDVLVQAHRPDLILLVEALYRVADPDLALHTVAANLPAAAHLLFTVPLPGRREESSGQPSRFDGERVRRMCAAAGLTVQHVEPLHGTWIVVLASRTPVLTPRALALPDRRHGEAA